MKYLVMCVRTFFLWISLLTSVGSFAQNTDTLAAYESSSLGVDASVWIDSIFITASKGGLDIEDFIQLMLEDSTLHQSFRQLRYTPHDLKHEITYFNKKGKTKDFYNGLHTQYTEENCRWMHIVSKDYSKRYFKRKKYRYYTSSLFSKIFYTKDTICKETNRVSSNKSASSIGYQIDLMKQIIFSPGLDLDIPIVGRKMALFSDKMRRYYNYIITTDTLQGQECYKFTVQSKPKYRDTRKIIVQELSTYFDKTDFSIKKRDYQMKYNNYLYKFDFHVSIKTKNIRSTLLPTYIHYDGYWDIPFKKPEIATFKVYFDYK